MPVPPHIENAYLKLVDTFFNHRPQRMPVAEKLNQCKIISHRGEHHGAIAENTLVAFDKAAHAGVWGVELDVRWTRDLVPVVAHDANTLRVYGATCEIAQTNHSELARRFPSLATLDEVVARFGKHVHLMIELKQQPWMDLPRQGDILSEVLRPLRSKVDYHLLSLTPQLLMDLPQFKPIAKIPIGYYLPDRLSHWVTSNRWGGICGHYLMMRRSIVARHKANNQQVGTGFADSVPTFLRELNRGIDWIFSNKASKLQAFVQKHLTIAHR